jgi:rSAM/selenodomain-associated transferase 1
MSIPGVLDGVALVIMAKEPRPGEVKTRLGATLGAEAAAQLYDAVLRDKLDQVAGVPAVTPIVAYRPETARAAFEAMVPGGFSLVPQVGEGLGETLANVSAHCFERGARAVVLVDSDSATLPPVYLERAARLLDEDAPDCDVVLGPTDDGGYYLVGLRQPCPALFDAIPWSTSGVMEATLERARAEGLRVELLPSWWDLDTIAELDRLRAELLDGWYPRRTAHWLRRNRPGASAGGEADPAQPETGPTRHWEQPWTRVRTRSAYANPWMAVREDRVRMPDGRTTLYGVVECGECVGVLPFVDEETVVMVGQYRYVADRVTWEMPTGGVHASESLDQAARRELAEEAGYSAEELLPLGSYHTSKSVIDEEAHLFVARGLRPVAALADATEFIRVEAMPFSLVLGMVERGEIVDSMTIIAVLLEAGRRGRRKSGG